MSLLVLALGYLLGSIPFSYIIARLVRGIDIRAVGTGNVGAHNVMWEVGRIAGLAALCLDTGKGAGAVLLARGLGADGWTTVACGLVAVVGHIFPLWLGFRGGGGMATSLGIGLTLLPLEGSICLAFFLVLYLVVTHNIAFSAGVVLVLASLLAWAFDRELPLRLAPLMLAAVMLVPQLPGVVRLWREADDKRALILDEFIFDRDARI